METHLYQDLAIVMAAAGAMTLLCHRLKQPVVIGYLLAGLLIGPFTLPFPLVKNLHSIHTMAELGLIFLLFSLGLEFNLPKIRKVGLSAGFAAVLEVIIMLGIGYMLGQAFGWSKMDSIFLGAILSISSTTIIVKVFMDFKMMQEKFAQVVFGILVLEDIVAIAILSILSGLGSHDGPEAGAIIGSFLRIGLFVTLFLVGGLLLIPRFIHWVASFRVKEVLGVVTLGLCLSGAMIAYYFDLSIALGAFLAGAVLASTAEIREIEEWVYPVRDMFSAIFFVSAGMLIQPELLWTYKVPIAIVTVVTIIGKVLSGTVGSYMAGYDIKTSTRVGMSLAQIGEFSFVIASLGLTLKVTSDFLYPLAVTVSSLTTLATPYLIRNSDRLVETCTAKLPPAMRARVERSQEKKALRGTSIFSKYLVRLGVYVAVLVATVALLNGISILFTNQATLLLTWTLGSLASVPLFMAITKYSNHTILLTITRSKTILRYLNVHLFYNTLEGLTMTALGFLYVAAAADFIAHIEIVLAVAMVVALLSVALREKMRAGQEGLEKLMDQITGLVTSEPTRQAVLKSGDHNILLVNITDQITLTADSSATGQTIRETKLREKTGASIVAIYREGKHIANPGPNATLAADDILVLLGNEEELEKARELFA